MNVFRFSQFPTIAPFRYMILNEGFSYINGWLDISWSSSHRQTPIVCVFWMYVIAGKTIPLIDRNNYAINLIYDYDFYLFLKYYWFVVVVVVSLWLIVYSICFCIYFYSILQCVSFLRSLFNVCHYCYYLEIESCKCRSDDEGQSIRLNRLDMLYFNVMFIRIYTFFFVREIICVWFCS